MKERIKKIYHVNTGWWDSFTSCFVGTLLGIIITFGASHYNTRQENKEMERKLQLITVWKIEKAMNKIETTLKELQSADSTYALVLDYFSKDSIDQIPPEVLSDLYGKISTVQFNSSDINMQDIFKNNFEIWKTMDPAAIYAMEELLATNNFSSSMISEIESNITTIRNNLLKKHFIFNFQSAQIASEAFFENPENVNLLIYTHGFITILSSCISQHKHMLDNLKNYLKINNKELEKLDLAYIHEDFQYHSSNAL